MLQAEDKVPWQRVLWLKQPEYPDNYLDDSFLINLQRNGQLNELRRLRVLTDAGCVLLLSCGDPMVGVFCLAVNVRRYTYSGLMVDTLPVTQHLSCIISFAAVFAHVYNGMSHSQSKLFAVLICIAGTMPAIYLLAFCVVCTAIGYYTWAYTLGNRNDGMLTGHPRLYVLTQAQAGLKIVTATLLITISLFFVSPIISALTRSTTSDSIWPLAAGLFLINILLADHGWQRKASVKAVQ